MKTRLTIVLALLLLAFCAIPTLAAPKLQLDLSFMYGQVGYDYGGDGPKGGYPGDYALNWALSPHFRIYAEVLPGFGLSAARWYACGEQYFSYGKPYEQTRRRPDSGGNTSIYCTQLMGEWHILDLLDARLSVQGGIRVLAVSQCLLEPAGVPESTALVYDYPEVSINTNLIGPALGISGQIRLAGGLWFFGNVSGAVLWGESCHSIPYIGQVNSATFAPQGDLQLGFKYDFTPNFYMAMSFRGSAAYINPNGDCREIVYAGGPQINLGFQY